MPLTDQDITLFAETNFRNQRRRFGIRTDDRRRHIYIIGKTGMGKTVLQENMVLSDIAAGHGVCYVDPHGDMAETLINHIPPHRINDVVYFNPADLSYPVGFNILESVDDSKKHLVGNGLMSVFKKIWPDVWSPRMEYILLNCVLALLDYPGATLLGINRLLVDEDYRNRVVAKIRDPIVKTFWVAEFASWTDKYKAEALPAIQNKVGQFLSASVIRNIVSQVKSTVDIRKIMDEEKIFIVNLSKGRIGEDNMRLLGGMLISRLQMAAMERVEIPEEDRKDFYLFVDEFQNFATESFASILSEARKYRLCLTVAHQYIEQLTEEVRAAIIGNVGTLIAFRIGSTDAQFLEPEFSPQFTVEDLVNLPKYTIYLKLMVDGMATPPFSATTLPPMARATGSEEKVIAVSRERYAVPVAEISEKVLRWSGMETASIRAATAAAAESNAVDSPMVSGTDSVDVPASIPEALQHASVTEEIKEPIHTPPKAPVEHLMKIEKSVLDAEQKEEKDEEEYLKISPERLKVLRTAPPKKEKPRFPHTCSRCGAVWEMPIQLDKSRPMYCTDCMPLMRQERKPADRPTREGFDRSSGPRPSFRDRRPDRSDRSLSSNRPRIVTTFRDDEEDVPVSMDKKKFSKKSDDSKLSSHAMPSLEPEAKPPTLVFKKPSSSGSTPLKPGDRVRF